MMSEKDDREIPEQDLEIIRRYAAIDVIHDAINSHLRQLAIDVHRKHIKEYGVRGTPAMRFMAEVDNPCPDLILRARYRNQLME